MRSVALLAGLVGSSLLVIGLSGATGTSSRSAPAVPSLLASAADSGIEVKAVRAVYAEESGRIPKIDTEVVITNTSVTTWVQLKDIVVLGRDGLNTVLSVHRGYSGRPVPPLGQVTIPVDANLGVVPRRSNAAPSPRDVSTVVVMWDGPANAVRLTATIKESAPGNGWGYYGTSVEQGFDLTF